MSGPVNQHDYVASPIFVGGCKSSGNKHNLDYLSSESLSLGPSAQLEHDDTHPSQPSSTALVHRSGTGTQQAGESLGPRLLGHNRSSQLSTLPFNSTTGALSSASQRAVQEALAAARSTAVSAGDKQIAEVLESMELQLRS